MKYGYLAPLLLLLASAGSVGCAGVALTLFGVGAGTGTGTASSYILDSIVYKTFNVPEPGLRAATLKTLKQMAMEVKEKQVTESGTKIVAAAGDRTVEIEVDRLTGRTSRLRVYVKQGWFWRDRATATEIIVQTERTLESEPWRAREATPPTAAGIPQK
jgi:hypothetical protein